MVPPKNMQAFSYATLFTFTAVAQTLTNTIPVQQDASFLWTMLCQSNTDTTSPQVFGGSLIQVTDQGGNKVLENTPVALDTIAGTAQRPFILPIPYQFIRSGSIVVQLQNQGIAAQQVRLTFHGIKLYDL